MKTNIESDKFKRGETHCSTWYVRAAFSTDFDTPYFYIDKILINDIPLTLNTIRITESLVEFEAYHDKLLDLIGKEVQVDYVVRSLVRKARMHLT